MEQVREDLQELLRADFAPPRNLSDCPALLDYLRGEFTGRLTEADDPEQWALALVFEAALRRGPTGRPNRRERRTTYPLIAAKHLLALGEYPRDLDAIVPDTTLSMNQIRELGGEHIQGSDPRASQSLGLRARIAALASGFGASRGVLEDNSTRLIEVATFLKKQVEDLLLENDVVVTLRSRLEWIDEIQAERAPSETVSPPFSSPERPIRAAEVDLVERRLKVRRRLRRRALSRVLEWLRQGYRPLLIPLAMLAIFLPIAVSTVASSFDATSDIDPLRARSAGDGWDPGFGPSSDVRLEQSPSGLLINRSGEWPTRGSFVRVLDGDSEVSGEIRPGEYTLVVDVGVREPRSGDASTVPADKLTGATAWIGTTRVANQATGFSYAVFARIAAEDTATVWSGAGLVMLCSCRVEIEPGSVRLYSDAFPSGTPVDDSILTTGAPIGYAGDDGVLRVGRDYDLRLTATLLIEERNWLPDNKVG